MKPTRVQPSGPISAAQAEHQHQYRIYEDATLEYLYYQGCVAYCRVEVPLTRLRRCLRRWETPERSVLAASTLFSGSHSQVGHKAELAMKTLRNNCTTTPKTGEHRPDYSKTALVRMPPSAQDQIKLTAEQAFANDLNDGHTLLQYGGEQ